MILGPPKPPAAGTPEWAVKRLRRLVVIKNHGLAYRYVPAVHDLVDAAIVSVLADIEATGDVAAVREASSLLTPPAVRR